jgi:outer membrane protein assembly factor BamB
MDAKIMKTKYCIGLMIVVFGLASFAGYAQDAEYRSSLAGDGFTVHPSPNGQAQNLYVGDQDRVICMDAQTGDILWTRKTPFGTVDVGPILADGTLVYVGGGGHFIIYGLDPVTGRQRWAKQQRSSLLATGDGRLFANTQSGRGITAFDAKTGKDDWNFNDPPGGSEDRLFYFRKAIYATDYVLDAVTGHIVSRPKTSLRAVTADSESIFTADVDGNLSVSLPNSRIPRWTVQTGKKQQVAGLAASKGRVFVALYDGYPDFARAGIIQAYNADDGGQIWKQEISTKNRALLWDPVTADSNNLYVLLPGNDENETILDSWDINSGKKQWTYTNAAGIIGPIVIVGHEIYANDAIGHIYVIDSGSGTLLRTLAYRRASVH